MSVRRYWGWISFLLAVSLTLATLCRPGLSTLYTNWGYIELSRLCHCTANCWQLESISIPYPNLSPLCTPDTLSPLLQAKAEKSYAAFEMATRLDPTNSQASWGIGRIALLRKQSPRAIQALSLPVQRNAQPLAYWYQAIAYHCVGDNEAAIEALVLGEVYPFARWLREAREQMQRGNCGEAVIAYQNAYGWAGGLALGEQVRIDFYRALACYYEREAQAVDATPDNILRAGIYLAMAGEWDRALPYLEQVVQASSGSFSPAARGLALFELAVQYEMTGRPERAAECYSLALQHNTQIIPAYNKLIEWHEQQGNAEQARRWTKALHELAPIYSLEVELDSGWTLAGYDLEDIWISTGAPVPITFYWRAPEAVYLADGLPPGYLRIGQYLVQTRWIQNVAPNSGFEWGTDTSDIPSFYSKLAYAPASYIKVLGTTDEHRNILMLRTDSQFHRNGIATQYYMPVRYPHYLLSAWIKTAEGGRGYVGVVCRSAADANESGHTWLMDGGIQVPSWTHFAQVKRFPCEAGGGYQVQVVNYEGVGEVWIDDLVVVPLESPKIVLSIDQAPPEGVGR
jgi:tetratricopeptide (TPR) repeat protein